MTTLLLASESSFETMLTLGGLLESPIEFWLWATLLLLILEIFTAGFFLGALAVSSVLTAGCGALGFSPSMQTACFALFSIGSLLWVRPVFVNLLSPHEVKTNTSALVGQAATVVAQVPAGSVGRVRLRNEEWRATSSATLHVGDAVRVLGVEGNTLTVGPA